MVLRSLTTNETVHKYINSHYLISLEKKRRQLRYISSLNLLLELLVQKGQAFQILEISYQLSEMQQESTKWQMTTENRNAGDRDWGIVLAINSKT